MNKREDTYCEESLHLGRYGAAHEGNQILLYGLESKEAIKNFDL